MIVLFRSFLIVIVCLLAGCQPSTPVAEPVGGLEADAEMIAKVTLRFVMPGDLVPEDLSGDGDPPSEDGRPEPLTVVVEDVITGTTLESLMRNLEYPEVQISGTGINAFVQEIDSVRTNGDRGWIFTIDDAFATAGIGSTVMTQPHTIVWRFTTFAEAQNLGASESQN